ncbi:hypothetical protein CWE08_09255 [Aliidiomarina iranensis]|uniref:NAD-dependent epimerase/dehydratase domain-containing protein n=1 Tax=Aliidiomarina iranensis TaxID=1434071 RepID=A0A432VT57_9GAMM|nr:NAD-dependent epimerase/dehydratase family protein [Aliidiomarina iranensis]RUO19609.1 hypothetical protein CWE08_09255 [Aliidiomarina iranensis]
MNPTQEKTGPNYLLTGSSGFIGRHLVDWCKQKQIDVILLARNKNVEKPIRFSENFSTVIHLAGRAHVLNESSDRHYDEFYKANCEYALNVARAASKKGLKRFVYVSTIGVYGKSSSECVITETTPLNPVENYSKTKLEAEKKLKTLSEELGFELVIVRPALVYGYDAPGNIASLFRLIEKFPIIPIAEKENKRALIYVENLVSFLMVVATHQNAAGKIFNVADGAISTHNLIAGFASGMSKKPVLFSLPRIVWKVLLKLMGKQKMYEQLFEDLVIDMTYATNELGWFPKHDTKTALEQSGRMFMQRKIL